jgi:nucleoside phosphorylase
VQQVTSTEPVKLVRTWHRSGNTCVHYSLIASGNQVVKDAELHDSLNESLSGNILYVEMEVAGLINNFPCVII